MTNDTITWAQTREDITNAYGEPPGPIIEPAIINHFEKNPTHVIRTANEVATALANGEIHSAWPILRARLERSSRPSRNVTVTKPDDRERKAKLAEQLIRNTAHEIPTQTELLDELFGDNNGRGLLHDWQTDQGLRARMTQLWESLRPEDALAEPETGTDDGGKRDGLTAEDAAVPTPSTGTGEPHSGSASAPTPDTTTEHEEAWA